MLTYTEPPPVQGYNLDRLQEECALQWSKRYLDCNETDNAKELTLYLEEPAEDADRSAFQALLAAHDPTDQSEAQADNAAVEAGTATLAKYTGLAYTALRPEEQAEVITAVLQLLGHADTAGFLASP